MSAGGKLSLSGQQKEVASAQWCKIIKNVQKFNISKIWILSVHWILGRIWEFWKMNFLNKNSEFASLWSGYYRIKPRNSFTYEKRLFTFQFSSERTMMISSRKHDQAEMRRSKKNQVCKNQTLFNHIIFTPSLEFFVAYSFRILL